MKKLNLFYWAIGALVLICPAVSSAQVTYVIDTYAPYSYVSGANSITSWVDDADDGYFDLPLGDFDFEFYGAPVTTLRISTNGYMTFGAEEGREFNNYPIPYSGPPNALIAPFWTDFDLVTNGQVRWGILGTSPSRQLVVEWLDVPFFMSPSSSISFEAILYEATNEIRFQYLNVISGTPYDQGSYATVGLENFDGTSGSQVSYNTPSLNNDLAIKFIPKITTVFLDDFSTDQGWTGYEPGGWERRDAVAGGGENANQDPGVDHSASGDNYILGFAIGADYPNGLVEKSIVSPPINCTEQNQVFLKFWRYLNVESNSYDHAKVHVSNDGVNWTQLWGNPLFDITDNQWTQVVFDISSTAANQETVYIKFTMGPTNATGPYSGWNIDDLEVTSNYGGPKALYVPSGISSKSNIDEMLIQAGLGVKHFTEVPSDLSDYALFILSEDGACNPTAANYIRDFVMTGGGAIIMNDTPKFLAGNTDDLSSIRDWFGAGSYGNDGDCGLVTIPNPFGTDLSVDDKVDYLTTAPAVFNLEPDATLVSKWSSDGAHSFFRRFGEGGVFYYAGNPGYSEDSDQIAVENGLILFEAGLSWAIGCIVPIINSQPHSQTIQSGQAASIWVNASGTRTLSYQWYQGLSDDTSNPIAGAITDSYTTPPLTRNTNYWVRISNSCGVANSNTAAITVTLLPVVTIVATDNTATETGPTTGTFTVSRGGSTSGDLVVYYKVSGTAAPGVDYISLAGSVIIPSGSPNATITVTPINDGLVENDEVVVVTLNGNSAYDIGSPSSDSVTIISSLPLLPMVTIVATDNTTTETGPTTGTFTVSREGSTSEDLVVYYDVSGTATSGVDYISLAGSVIIPSGSPNATITITPINDGLVENDETVVVTLNANSAYDVGPPSSDSVTIISDNVNVKVKLISPNGGEVLPSGSSQTIQWQGPPKAVTFKLAYSVNNGQTWSVIPGNLSGTNHEWIVPTPTGNKKACLVKVVAYNSSHVKVGADKSDGPFRIEVVKLTSPNGGETLTSGTAYPITWTTNGTAREVASVVIQYTTDGGVTWKKAGTEIGNPETHTWTPWVANRKMKCKIRVVLKDKNGFRVGTDASDTFFTIIPAQ